VRLAGARAELSRGRAAAANGRRRRAHQRAGAGGASRARTLLDSGEDGRHGRGDDGLGRLERHQRVREPARVQLGPAAVGRRGGGGWRGWLLG
jgi:hypothetical protein